MLRPSMYAVPDAKQDIRVPDVRFAEYPASAVAGALGLRARGGLKVVHEPSDGAAFDQPRGPRGDTFVVDGPGRRPARSERIVDDRQPLIEHHCSDFAASGELPWSTVFPDSACSSGSTTAARPAGVNTTGSEPSGGVTMVSAAERRVSIERISASRSPSLGMSAPT